MDVCVLGGGSPGPELLPTVRSARTQGSTMSNCSLTPPPSLCTYPSSPPAGQHCGPCTWGCTMRSSLTPPPPKLPELIGRPALRPPYLRQYNEQLQQAGQCCIRGRGAQLVRKPPHGAALAPLRGGQVNGERGQREGQLRAHWRRAPAGWKGGG